MDMRKFGHYLGMIVTAPGRELYRGCGRLKERQDIVRTALLVIVLALLTILLWLLRGSLTRMLIFGIALAVVCFYLYFLLLKHTDAVIGFAEKMSRPFDTAFARHAHAVYGRRQGKKQERSKTGKTKAKTQERPKESEKIAGSSAPKKEPQKETAKEKHNDRYSEHRNGQSGQYEKNASGGERSGNSGSHTGKSGSNEAFEEAQLIYAVRLPYTTDEIKQKRNLLLKRYHPDNAEGSEEMCKKINECYRILSRYAS